MKPTRQQETVRNLFETSKGRAWKDLLFCAVASSALLGGMSSNFLHAQERAVVDKPVASRLYSFDIPSVPLMRALELLSQQAGIPFSVQDGTNLAMNGQAVVGQLSIENALFQMLEGTEVTFAVTDGVLVISPKLSNQSSDEEIVTAPVSVSANRTTIFQLGTGAASGSTVYGEEMIGAVVQGDSDPNKIFRANPNVQFQASSANSTTQNRLSESGATSVKEQDLRPAGMSISGGRVDQNNIMIDGVGINSYFAAEGLGNDPANMPSDDTNLPNPNLVYGVHPQSVYIDSNILEQAEIFDSNVSAKYGGFQGGVVNYTIKNPSEKPEFSASINRGGSNWTDYHLKSRDEADSDAREPKFERLSYGGSASTPLNENWGMLVSVSRRTAETTRAADADYLLMEDVTTETVADNVLAKLRYENDDGLGLTFQTVYAPYAQEWASSRRYDSSMDIKGDGLNSYVGLDTPLSWKGYGFSDVNFDTKLSINSSKTGRDAETNTALEVRGNDGGKYDPFCDSTTCNFGTLGDLYQSQQEISYQADFEARHYSNKLGFGADIRRIEAEIERPETARRYYSATANAGIVCAVPGDISCEDGVQANRRLLEYRAYKGGADFYTGALYTQYALNLDAIPFGDLEVQPGLRVERDTFLRNTNLAPRFNATYYTDLGIDFNLGWNRYFASNMLSYALNDLSPGVDSYSRSVGAGAVGDYDLLTLGGGRTNYGGQRLKTPFTDERAAAVSFPLPMLGGQTRLKVVDRNGRDQFSRVEGETGSSSYTLSNEGKSSYRSYSIEWAKKFEDRFLDASHTFSINGQYAERETSNNSYFGSNEEEEDIVFNGQVVSPNALSLISGNLDEPWLINAALYSEFDDGRLRTGLTGRYTFSYEIVADSGDNQNIGGVVYDVYEMRPEKARFDLDMTLDYDVVREDSGTLTLNVSIDNVLNRGGAHTLVSDTPYRKGRTVWLGLTYTY
ncbi:hypothetical protein ABIE64_001883 [Thalassospira sp. MBR-102]|jgi:hypothetical protein|uniref:hypothetical protein n=1 Tax=Thalassospira sp. MBR-102 TaxID=3156466 RepID=UPI00339980D2